MKTLKDLNRTIKKLITKGYEVEKFNGYINNRKAFYINGRLYTDYEVITNF